MALTRDSGGEKENRGRVTREIKEERKGELVRMNLDRELYINLSQTMGKKRNLWEKKRGLY